MIKKRSAVSILVMIWLSVFFICSVYAQKPQARTSRENLTTLVLLRMTQVLDLTEEQTALLFPKITRVEKEKAKMLREIGIRLRELRSMLKDEDPDMERLEKRIEEIKSLRHQIKVKEAEVEEIVEKILTLEQRAKYLIFFQDFYRFLRERLSEAREKQERQRVKK